MSDVAAPDGAKGKLNLDSKRIKADLQSFLQLENRFMVLQRKDPEAASKLASTLEQQIELRHDRLMNMSKASAEKKEE